jgi:hypothetical protein
MAAVLYSNASKCGKSRPKSENRVLCTGFESFSYEVI